MIKEFKKIYTIVVWFIVCLYDSYDLHNLYNYHIIVYQEPDINPMWYDNDNGFFFHTIIIRLWQQWKKLAIRLKKTYRII